MNEEMRVMAEESLTRFKKHLPRSKDLTLVVLKGHLLLEAELNELIDVQLKDPNALKDARLNFYQKLCLVRAVSPLGTLEGEIWEAARLLNTLRNKLAHNLDPKNLDATVVKLLAKIEDPDTSNAKWAEETLDHRLKRCLAALCGYFSGLKRALEFIKPE